MLRLRSALKTALGSSLTVSHKGTDGTTRNVTVPIVDAGIDEQTNLPAVFFQGQFGNTEATDIGAQGAGHEVYVELHIVTCDGDSGHQYWNGPQLLEDIHAALETAIRAVQKTVGTSYFTLATHHRDFPPRSTESTGFWYTRYVQVRGVSLESY